MRIRYVQFAIFLLSLVAVGCSSANVQPTPGVGKSESPITVATDRNADPHDEVVKAARRFLAKQNIQITSEVVAGDRTMSYKIDYIAPDRYRMAMGLPGMSGTETIWIGKDRYVKFGDSWKRPPTVISNPPAGFVRSIFTDEKLAGFIDVRVIGEETLDGHIALVYTYQDTKQSSRNYCPGKMWVEKNTGLPVRVENDCSNKDKKVLKTTLVFSYDTSVTIDPPATEEPQTVSRSG